MVSKPIAYISLLLWWRYLVLGLTIVLLDDIKYFNEFLKTVIGFVVIEVIIYLGINSLNLYYATLAPLSYILPLLIEVLFIVDIMHLLYLIITMRVVQNFGGIEKKVMNNVCNYFKGII